MAFFCAELCRQPISRILSGFASETTIPLGAPLLTRSSNLPGGFRRSCFCKQKRSSRWRAGPARTAAYGAGPRFPPYLVLLRVGFTLPFALPQKRCALTAPFHPYLPCLRKTGGIFSVALAVSRALKPGPRALPGTLPCGVRTFLPRATFARARQRPSSCPQLRFYPDSKNGYSRQDCKTPCTRRTTPACGLYNLPALSGRTGYRSMAHLRSASGWKARSGTHR